MRYGILLFALIGMIKPYLVFIFIVWWHWLIFYFSSVADENGNSSHAQSNSLHTIWTLCTSTATSRTPFTTFCTPFSTLHTLFPTAHGPPPTADRPLFGEKPPILNSRQNICLIVHFRWKRRWVGVWILDCQQENPRTQMLTIPPSWPTCLFPLLKPLPIILLNIGSVNNWNGNVVKMGFVCSYCLPVKALPDFVTNYLSLKWACERVRSEPSDCGC